MTKQIQEVDPLIDYRAFDDVNLSNARAEDETFENYKKRRKQNENMLKLYSQVGRETFSKLFPGGVAEALASIEKEAFEEPKEKINE
jgi:hypothetical protein|tara:strand:+ start:2229 stop:2489 length:261 start_codon:yes stop_codon:yes gene_type:complete